MTISRVKPAGWGTNETLTSTQATALDVNTVSALDKRSGQTDTLSSTVTVAAAFAFSVAQPFGVAAPAFSTTLNLDFSTANVFTIPVATGNTTITPSNVQSGALYVVRYTQSVAGSNTITWAGTVLFGSVSSTPDAGAGNHTTWLFVGIGTAVLALARNVV